jgi:hypothetical protein
MNTVLELDNQQVARTELHTATSLYRSSTLSGVKIVKDLSVVVVQSASFSMQMYFKV